jgi:hypothetical protein
VTPPAAQQKTDNFGTRPEDRLLWTLQQIESSGGKNTEHQLTPHMKRHFEKYRGDAAIGRWGLLKPTIRDMVIRMHSDGVATPMHQALENMTRDQINEHFTKNPQHELEIARYMARHVLSRQKGDVRKAAYSWLMGHNLHPEDISEENLGHSDYINKFQHFDAANPLKRKFATQKPPKAPKVAMGRSTLKPIQKSESDSDFRMRFRLWKQRRDEKGHSLAPPTTSMNPDPGRLREPALDKEPATLADGPIAYLKDKFKERQ